LVAGRSRVGTPLLLFIFPGFDLPTTDDSRPASSDCL
jgi:hypothetical protein